MTTTTTMVEETLARLVKVAPGLINGFTKPGPHCVLATAVGCMTLARFGIEAGPYPVAVSVCNKAWIDWQTDGYPGGIEEQQRRGAYLLSNSPDWKGVSFMRKEIDRPWDGHLVLRVPDGDRAWLVDLDLGSFNRPLRSIRLPGGLVAPLSKSGTVFGVCTDEQVETTVEYRPLVASYRDDYIKARDWAERERFLPEVEQLVKVLSAMGKRRR